MSHKVGPNSGAENNRTRRHRELGTVLALALAARCLVLWSVFQHFSAAWFFHRGTEMGLLAQSLLQGRGLSSPFGGATGPTAFIAPGYPLFVALVFKIFGSYTTRSAMVLMGTNVVLNLATIWCIMQVARRLSNQRAALLAGLFWALSPPLIWMPTIFWETNVSCFVIAASLMFAVQLRRPPGNAGFLLLGACLAVAGLINPALLPLLLGMLLWVAYHFRTGRRSALLLALLGFLVVFSPWPMRNARVFHAFIPLRSTVGFEMWMGNRPRATGYLEESLFPTFNTVELQKYVREGEVAYVAEKSSEAEDYIETHPVTFMSLTLRRFVRFWTGSGSHNGSPFFILHACISTALGLVGLGFLARRQPAIACLCALPLLFFPVPYYLTHAEFRYRLVLDPLLTVLAACGVGALLDWPKTVRCKASEFVNT
jgi:4-amino-4-deoxy-L-arabinose transferase-like glycosyltransferase